MRDKLAIFSGNSNRELAGEICDYLGVSLGDALVSRFPDGEVHVQINENIRGKDVFIVQPTSTPPNENLMELLILIDAARRASAMRVTAVLPFFGYARQDRKDKPRVPITSKLISNLLTTAGANRVLTMDLHAGQIQGFFDIPVDHLYSINVIVEYLQSLHLRNAVVVTPDIGGVRMARAYSKVLGFSLAIVDKRRESDRQTKVMNIIGDVKGRNVILVDDMVSTGGSLVEAVGALKDEGALDVYAAIVHPVLAESAAAKLERSPLKEIVVTNSIPLGPAKQGPKFHVVSVAPLLAEAIRRIHNDESVSALFSRAVVES